MTTPLDRRPWTRVAASVALLLHLFLVGFVPAGEGLHLHGHVPGAEWHTDGEHQHGDEAEGCPLLCATTSAGLTTDPVETSEVRPAAQTLVIVVPESPTPASPWTPVTARGPPAR